ncbi:hypothetical protein NX059_011089 [Plenodomus lindquistii]|nr:hypothetical protein NX059_011089 [Plenodomus lindquistii]
MSAHSTPASLPDRRKRVRFPSSEPTNSNSSSSTLIPTSTTSLSTDASDLSDSDSDSDLSTSSEEPSDESSEDSDSDQDDDENSSSDTAMETTSTTTPPPISATPTAQPPTTVENLRANRGKKPAFKFDPTDLGPDIRDFLKDFLPQLKKANEELEAQKRAGTLRKLDELPEKEDEPYIEMDLGLGVLEAKEEGRESSSGSDEEMGEGEEERDVMGKLLGRGKKGEERVGIEVVRDVSMEG